MDRRRPARRTGPSGSREIAPGWYGGATLAAAIEPARHLPADLPIVVQGETGTGKEGMARAIHGWSGRDGPIVAVNCAALPSELAEAELFGYRKGAFTGAESSSPGLFRAADGGSLFLDEILELPLSLQPKLLRVLEDRRVRPLGETRDVADRRADHRRDAGAARRAPSRSIAFAPICRPASTA